jgi:signal transduction histidine kinase/ActR/RegA family two-component response regulator
MVQCDHVREIRAAQVRLLYEQLPPALIATIVNAAILIVVLWREVSQVVLIGWLLAICLVAYVRYGRRRAYLRDASANAESMRWGRHYLYGVAANGVLWGFAGSFFFTEHSYVHQVFLAFVLMGMVSGSTSTLSPMRGAYLVFLIPALFPYAARLVSVGSELHLAMAGMLVLYVTMMAIISDRFYATVAESLRLRFDNLGLLDDLRQAKERQELANQELAAQVAEKLSAQDALEKAYAELERRVEERTAELAKSEEALRNADRRKDEFLAMLGHELRNPLAPIRNALQLMHKPGVSDSLVKWGREIIDRQIDHLTRLVDDLLDVSRIVHGKISLQEATFDITTVINQAVEGSRPLIEARHQKLSVRIPEELIWVKGDLVRLAQVVSNLLNNAAKYSDVGERIRLDVLASERWVTIRVQDSGIGIQSDVLPHVFDLFAQADHSLARTQGGLGIGLTLVKRLVEMHDGRVEAHSQGPGYGSEFLVHLPRRTAPAETLMPESLDKRVVGSEEPLRVLVVDDNHDAVESLALLMRLEGHTVAVAFDGVAALAEAARFQPQVVLLDIGMPGMDGYQVARELRAREPTKSTVIVALTGYGQPEDRARSDAAGFTDHLTKPVNPESLMAVLKAHTAGLLR